MSNGNRPFIVKPFRVPVRVRYGPLTAADFESRLYVSRPRVEGEHARKLCLRIAVDGPPSVRFSPDTQTLVCFDSVWAPGDVEASWKVLVPRTATPDEVRIRATVYYADDPDNTHTRFGTSDLLEG